MLLANRELTSTHGRCSCSYFEVADFVLFMLLCCGKTRDLVLAVFVLAQMRSAARWSAAGLPKVHPAWCACSSARLHRNRVKILCENRGSVALRSSVRMNMPFGSVAKSAKAWLDGY